MTITAALVLFAVTWFMVFFCVLPIRFQAQGELGEVTQGTPASAPQNARIRKKAKITTAVAVVIFGALYAVITSGAVTVDNMDIFGVMARVPAATGP